MNIQQYYRSSATVSLNGSLVAFIPVGIILIGSIYSSVKLPFFYLILPFCLYSFICYQNYLIELHRSLEAIVTESSREPSLLNSKNILVTFMPAPSLRMLLFDPDGLLIGEVKDIKFWRWRWFLPYFIDRIFPNVYGLYNQKNQLLAYYQVNKRKRYMKVYNSTKKEIGIYNVHTESSLSLRRKGVIHSYHKKQDMEVEGSLIYPGVKIRNEDKFIISKLIKGWLPLEWGKHFRDPNTPVIVFEENMDETDKILIIGVLTDFFRYTCH